MSEPPRRAARRLHHAPLSETGGELDLSDAAHRHARVLRLGVGDPLVLFDGSGREADARITALDPVLRCSVEPARDVASDLPRLTLCQCVPKGSKLDAIVRATTEVGVSSIHLAISTRCVARPSAKASDKLRRLRRIATEAARQSGRATVPEVLAPASLFEVAARAPQTVRRLVAAPGGRAIGDPGADAWLVVGPEGGLSEAEIVHLEELGFERVSLGPTILRTETAAVVGCALVAAGARRRRFGECA